MNSIFTPLKIYFEFKIDIKNIILIILIILIITIIMTNLSPPSNLLETSSEHTFSPSIELETSSEQNDELTEISLDEQNEDICSICLNMDEDEWMELNNCKHTFHRHCIMTWGRIIPKCPLCRANAPEIAPANAADVIILGPHLHNTELAVYLATHLGNGPNQPMDRGLLFIMRLYVITFKLFVIKWGYDLSAEAWDYYYTHGHWKDTVEIPHPSSPWSSDLTGQTSVHDTLIGTTAQNPNNNLDAMTERVNEACARDAAAIAGDPEAIAAVEADKIRATISDPEKMKEWVENHPEWHTPEWHAKHDAIVHDAAVIPYVAKFIKIHPTWHASETSEGVTAAIEAANNRVDTVIEAAANDHLVTDSNEGFIATIVDWWHACSDIHNHILV